MKTGRTAHGPRDWGTLWVSGLGLLFFIVIGLGASWIAPHDPVAVDVTRRLLPPAWLPGGSPTHWLGTDELGRDVLSRIVYGARTSLATAGLAVLAGGFAGTGLGLAAGYVRSVDRITGRLADIQQALPFIVLALAVTAVTEPSFANIVLVLGIGSWVNHYRVVRGATMAVREQPYIEAARALGHGPFGIVRRHVLPNVLPVIVVNATNFVPQLMLFEASLSFLGMGVPPPTPTWGGMIAAGRGYVEIAWWMSVFPGLALLGAVLAVYGVAEGLSRRLDPRGGLPLYDE